MFTQTHVMEEIREQMMVPMHAPSDMHAQASGNTAKGAALAETALREAKVQSNSWKMIYQSLCELDSDGRKAFRKTIGEAVHTPADAKGDAVATATYRSAKVRLSELTTICKAMDSLVPFDPEWSFHYAIGVARTALHSDASATTKRGRKETPLLIKVRNFLLKNVPEEEWGNLQEMVNTLSNFRSA